MRRKPPGKLLPSAHAVDREYRVIAALYPLGFPVAKPYGLCEDESVTGTMFYIMDMVEGRILWDQTLPAYAPAERNAIFRAKIKTLADLHNTDYVKVGLADYGRPGNYMSRQVDRWTKQYKASETVHIPEVERLIAWLPTSVPEQERTSVVHGDYRLDNMIFHPTESRVTAVLDWELGTLGEPLADFTYVLMNWVNGSISTLPDLKAHGLPTLEEAVEYYCQLTGRSDLGFEADLGTWRVEPDDVLVRARGLGVPRPGLGIDVGGGQHDRAGRVDPQGIAAQVRAVMTSPFRAGDAWRAW